MLEDTFIQVVSSGIVIVVNVLTVCVGVRALRDVYRRIRALEAHVTPPVVYQYPPQIPYATPVSLPPVNYDPV
jgi:hypothetical protein